MFLRYAKDVERGTYTSNKLNSVKQLLKLRLCKLARDLRKHNWQFVRVVKEKD